MSAMRWGQPPTSLMKMGLSLTNPALSQLGDEMLQNWDRIRTDIAVVRPAGSKGEMYDLEFLGQQNTQNLIDATVQRIQNKKK